MHLRHQELVAQTALPGGWQVVPEATLGGAGIADILLSRGTEAALVEVWDFFADVGAAFRSWNRKLEQLAAREYESVSGCWVVRATRRNRRLIASHRGIFRARFPENGGAWLTAFSTPTRQAPRGAALLWVSVKGDRLFPMRLPS